MILIWKFISELDLEYFHGENCNLNPGSEKKTIILILTQPLMIGAKRSACYHAIEITSVIRCHKWVGY